jgi:hypothetical protein
MIPLVCPHCGRVFTDSTEFFLNPWLMRYQCAGRPKSEPGCDAGRRWYAENIWETPAGRRLLPRPAPATP